MKTKRKRSYEISKEGWIKTYPAIHEIKEKSRTNYIARLLQRLKKGP